MTVKLDKSFLNNWILKFEEYHEINGINISDKICQ